MLVTRVRGSGWLSGETQSSTSCNYQVRQILVNLLETREESKVGQIHLTAAEELQLFLERHILTSTETCIIWSKESFLFLLIWHVATETISLEGIFSTWTGLDSNPVQNPLISKGAWSHPNSILKAYKLVGIGVMSSLVLYGIHYYYITTAS